MNWNGVFSLINCVQAQQVLQMLKHIFLKLHFSIYPSVRACVSPSLPPSFLTLFQSIYPKYLFLEALILRSIFSVINLAFSDGPTYNYLKLQSYLDFPKFRDGCWYKNDVMVQVVFPFWAAIGKGSIFLYFLTLTHITSGLKKNAAFIESRDILYTEHVVLCFPHNH